jgi:hypothetical protein
MTTIRVLQFHDSTVASIACEGSTASLIFSAAFLWAWDGTEGVDETTGWADEGRLEFAEVSSLDEVDLGEGWLMDGQVLVDSEEHLGRLEIPFDKTGQVSACFTFNNGSVARIEAGAVRLSLSGNPKYLGTEPKSDLI